MPIRVAAERPHIAVIGGGLAGLAAASALVQHNVRVTLLESRPRLGGRASSIVDNTTGQTIDNCQHVTMGCCTSFSHFSEVLGFADLLQPQSQLYFVGPPKADRPPDIVPFSASPLPAPFHLGLAFSRLPWFGLAEKCQIAFGLRALARTPDDADEPFDAWLARNGQSETVQRDFWHLVLVSALSESLDRISRRHARKVFVDSFLASRTGWRVSIPTVPLETIYELRISNWFDRHDAEVRLQSGVRQLTLKDGRIQQAELRSGETLTADAFVLAVPQWLVKSLLPEPLTTESWVTDLDQLQTAPIASAHLWFDQPITSLPHATLLNRRSQWLFNRSLLQADESEPGTSHLQVVISAAHDLSHVSETDLLQQIESELRAIWPESSSAKLLHGRIITEHRAVFSPLAGVDDLRPSQQTSMPNLLVAGDWTQTGWPATMEGAVRSGYLAAQNALAALDRPAQCTQPDLPDARLYRLFLGTA